MNALQQFLQSASNAVASNVSGPVDLISAGLRAMSVPVPQNALMSSQWMQEQGLTAPVPQGAARVLGETAGMVGPTLAAQFAPQVAAGMNALSANAMAPRTLRPERGAIVWHGSPHKFDRFDSSKIGTGEGAQAYGHGIYVADEHEVAKNYSGLSFINKSLLDNQKELVNKVIQAAKNPLWGKPQNLTVEDVLLTRTDLFPDSRVNNALIKYLNTGEVPQGYMYRVDLPDEAIARMLDWDRPLSQQAAQIKEFFEPVVAPRRAIEAQLPTAAERAAWGDLANPRIYDPTGKEVLFAFGKGRNEWAASPAAAQMLKERGIPGIRYLDGGSRGAGQGTYNYVVFPGEENLLTILERNGQPLR